MDAFSLAITIGTIIKAKKSQLILSSSVGIFHFFMPMIGNLVGHIFTRALHLESHFLSFVIFTYIAIMMFKDYKEEKREIFKMSVISIILFAFGVSLDSFGVGFALDLDIYRMIKSSLVFSITSFLFTLVGLLLGNKLHKLLGNYSVLLGSIIMFILALINFCQFLLL